MGMKRPMISNNVFFENKVGYQVCSVKHVGLRIPYKSYSVAAPFVEDGKRKPELLPKFSQCKLRSSCNHTSGRRHASHVLPDTL